MDELKELIELLKNNSRTLYSSDEKNEILYSQYTAIVTALLVEADVFIVTPSQTIYLNKENDAIIKFAEEIVKVDLVSNVEMIDFIMSRDKLVASLLKLISRDNNEIRFKIEVADFMRNKAEDK